MTADPLAMTAVEADQFYTAALRRVADLRADPKVQEILAAAVTADRAKLRRLHEAWLDHFRVFRNEQTRLWHAFARECGQWRSVSTLGYQTEALVREMTDGGYWGAQHAVADAVKAVHMAEHVPTGDLDLIYTRPWTTVMAST